MIRRMISNVPASFQNGRTRVNVLVDRINDQLSGANLPTPVVVGTGQPRVQVYSGSNPPPTTYKESRTPEQIAAEANLKQQALSPVLLPVAELPIAPPVVAPFGTSDTKPSFLNDPTIKAIVDSAKAEVANLQPTPNDPYSRSNFLKNSVSKEDAIAMFQAIEKNMGQNATKVTDKAKVRINTNDSILSTQEMDTQYAENDKLKSAFDPTRPLDENGNLPLSAKEAFFSQSLHQIREANISGANGSRFAQTPMFASYLSDDGGKTDTVVYPDWSENQVIKQIQGITQKDLETLMSLDGNADDLSGTDILINTKLNNEYTGNIGSWGYSGGPTEDEAKAKSQAFLDKFKTPATPTPVVTPPPAPVVTPPVATPTPAPVVTPPVATPTPETEPNAIISTLKTILPLLLAQKTSSASATPQHNQQMVMLIVQILLALLKK